MELLELRQRVIETHPDRIGPNKIHLRYSRSYQRALTREKKKRTLIGFDKELYDYVCANAGVITTRVIQHFNYNQNRTRRSFVRSRLFRLVSRKYLTAELIRTSERCRRNLYWYPIDLAQPKKTERLSA